VSSDQNPHEHEDDEDEVHFTLGSGLPSDVPPHIAAILGSIAGAVSESLNDVRESKFATVFWQSMKSIGQKATSFELRCDAAYPLGVKRDKEEWIARATDKDGKSFEANEGNPIRALFVLAEQMRDKHVHGPECVPDAFRERRN
jgi:hypothetical protein